MKLLIASDIHGSLDAAKQLIEVFEYHQADKLIILGDFLYHGPRNPLPTSYAPAQVAELLNHYKKHIIGVRGNCDSEVDQMLLEFPMTETYAQVVVDKFSFFLTHGHVYIPSDEIHLHHHVFISGHTHIPILEMDGSRQQIVMNPGSVSLPKGGHQPTYGLYENGQLEVRYFDHTVLYSMCLDA